MITKLSDKKVAQDQLVGLIRAFLKETDPFKACAFDQDITKNLSCKSKDEICNLLISFIDAYDQERRKEYCIPETSMEEKKSYMQVRFQEAINLIDQSPVFRDTPKLQGDELKGFQNGMIHQKKMILELLAKVANR